MHRNHPPYPVQFREQMVELVRAGRQPKELADEFGCHVSSILNWERQADKASGVTLTNSVALNATERQELIELRRKLRQVQRERDILAKATAWVAGLGPFAHNGDKTSTPSTR